MIILFNLLTICNQPILSIYHTRYSNAGSLKVS